MLHHAGCGAKTETVRRRRSEYHLVSEPHEHFFRYVRGFGRVVTVDSIGERSRRKRSKVRGDEGVADVAAGEAGDEVGADEGVAWMQCRRRRGG